ncbi:MAG TPA: Bug family tripartite tricarboxylate transporter substrate binding protein [Burkholderiales bacterium]|nr:Bug family tripartite tricarboxylate transporter substrate binding protein [Burkholderiales bacterium]
MFRFLAALLAALAAQHAVAQDGSIRLVLGFPAGATADLLTRVVADHMRQSLGQPVIVENKVGAGGRVANEYVKAARPDGTTLLMTPFATMSIFPHSFGNLRYDPFTDFEPVAHLSDFHSAFAVGAAVPAKSLKEYVELVKKNPKMGDYASPAAGSVPHFLGVMFARAAGIDVTHVPYKGTAPALQALASGEIAAAILLSADINTLVKSGKARALAVSGAGRDPLYPEVPTFREQGYDIEGTGWYALFAPAGVPKPLLERLSKAAAAAIHDPEVKQKLTTFGLQPTGHGPAELARIMKADYDKWGPVIRASGWKPLN